VRRADNLTTLMCQMSWNLGASTSWNPQGLSRCVMGLLYLFTFLSRSCQDKRIYMWCEFDRASLLIRGNKMPTRCNRLVFYCRTYCLLNMFRAPLCQSSGALELYRCLLPVVLGSLVHRSLVWCVTVGYIPQTRHITHSSTADQRPVNQRTNCHRQQPSV